MGILLHLLLIWWLVKFNTRVLLSTEVLFYSE